jgi:hypothetical protein
VPEPESPREVFLGACARIAESLSGLGFSFARSGPHATRRAQGLRFRIRFQSDRYNEAGRHVGLIVHAAVESDALARWLPGSPWPYEADPFLGGGQLGNLRMPRTWWQWELADPRGRPNQIDDATARIGSVLLPFFDRYSDLPSLARTLAGAEIAGIEDETAVRLCYWQLGRDAAEACLALWMDRYSGTLGEFRCERDRVASGGRPVPFVGNAALRLAGIAGTLGLGLQL